MAATNTFDPMESNVGAALRGRPLFITWTINKLHLAVAALTRGFGLAVLFAKDCFA